MKVILLQDVKKQGKKDQIINAADGYARNFLLPKGLAVPADTGNMNNLKAKNALNNSNIVITDEMNESINSILVGEHIIENDVKKLKK